MVRLRASIAAAALAVGACFSAWAGQPAGLPGQEIADVVASALQEYGVPGAAVAIATPDGRWVRTFGFADVASDQPVRPADRFAIRSITKSFVVTAVLQLIAESDGAVSLDEPIGKYLDGVANTASPFASSRT